MHMLARFVLSLAAIGAHAQSTGGYPMPSAGELAQARAACDQLAAMPNPPMSAGACRSMLGMAEQMDAASRDPTARRAGDDAMSCDAIFVELQGVAGAGLSDATRERAGTLATEGQALAGQQAGEITAFIAESHAMGLAAGALSAVTPNFVGAALAAVWQAQAVALAARQSAAQAPLRAQMNATVIESMEDLDRSMLANPRFARLGQLAMQKQCEPPADAPR